MKKHVLRFLTFRDRRCWLVAPLFAVLMIWALPSCNKNDFDFSKMTKPEWSPTWTLPLIHSDLTLRDILKKGNSIFIEDPETHMLTLEYEARLFSQSAQQHMQIPDQNNIKVETSTLYIEVAPGDSFVYQLSAPYSFSPQKPGQRLDSIFIKSALIDIDVSSMINHTASVAIRLPGAVKNGKTFDTIFPLPYLNDLPVHLIKQLDFSGYKLLFENDPGHLNEFTLEVDIKVYGDNNPNNSPYSFKVKCDLTNIKFSKIFGYLGQYEYPLSDTLFINLFKNNVQGGIHLEEIDMLLTTSTSIGMPLELNFLDLLAYSAKNPPHTIDIADPNSGFPNPITIPSPDIAHVGTVKDTTFQFGENNSNIIPAINMSPEYIYFNVKGKSNPANNPAYENFIFDTSRIAVDIKVVLPLFGKINGFYVEDTVKFDFNIPDMASMIDFKVRTENHFPLDAEIQIYFADQNYHILDSLFNGSDHHILVAAPVGPAPDYRVIETPPIQPYTFSPSPFYADDLERMKQVRFLMIQAKLSTYQRELVKIYADYKLDVKLAAKITLKSQK
ncbi:MAG: hypothetical protein WCI71_04855 [Bacteroidota bacterium]